MTGSARTTMTSRRAAADLGVPHGGSDRDGGPHVATPGRGLRSELEVQDPPAVHVGGRQVGAVERLAVQRRALHVLHGRGLVDAVGADRAARGARWSR